MSNIIDSVSKKDIQLLFESVGPIFDIKINKDKTTIIVYTNDEHAKQAINDLNNVLLDNQRIVVSLYMRDYNHPYLEPLDLTSEAAPLAYGSNGWISQVPYNYGDEEYVPHSPKLDASGAGASASTPSYESYLSQSPDFSVKSPVFDLTQDSSKVEDYDYGGEMPAEYGSPIDNKFKGSVIDFDAPSPDYSVSKSLADNQSKSLEGGSISETSDDDIKHINIDFNKMIDSKHTQRGGGGQDFAEINLGNDNLLSDGLSGSHTEDLSNIDAPTDSLSGGSGELDFSNLNLTETLDAVNLESGSNSGEGLNEVNLTESLDAINLDLDSDSNSSSGLNDINLTESLDAVNLGNGSNSSSGWVLLRRLS